MALSNAKPGWLTQAVNNLFNRNQVFYNPAPPMFIGGLPIYPNPNTIQFVNEYCENATVYTVISTAARKFGYLPRYVYQITDKTAQKQFTNLIKQREYKTNKLFKLQKKAYNEQIVDNAFAELMARPNKTEGQDSFYARALVYFLTTGESFIWLNRGELTDVNNLPLDDDAADKLPVLEMYVLPSQYMELVADPDDVWGVLGYVFNQNGKRIPIRKNDIIHWKMPNPQFDATLRVHLRGLSPLQPGNKLVEQDDSATDASVAMQQNDGAKGALFQKSLANIDAVQKTQLQNVIDRKVNNRDIKGAIATLQGDWGYLNFGATSVDMELLKSQEVVFIRICNLIGVNPMMFLANATYENIKEARKDLITGLLLPLSCSLRDEMNRALLPAFNLDKSYTIDVDVTNLAELQEDMTQKVTQLSSAWWLTPNQKLEEMNEDKSTDPNMDKVWVPTTIVLMDDAAMTDTLNSFTDAQPNPKNSGGNVSDNLGRQSGKKPKG